MDKVFASFQTVIGTSPFWRHNTGAFNNFYGTVVGSQFSVSFNQKPSENKILKSISVEGTSNSNPNAIVVANNSTVAGQAKQSDVIAFDDHGGIMYGVIEGLARNSTANINYVGSLRGSIINGVEQIQLISDADAGTLNFFGRFTYHDGGQSYVTDLSKYLIRISVTDDGGVITNPLVSNSLDDQTDTLTGDFGDVLDNIQFDGGSLIIDTSDIDYAVVLSALSSIQLFAITPTNMNGDMLRGQYADAVFSFGSADWEVFAVNLEYEPTTYDHSKAAAMPSRRRGSRRRRR